MMIVEIPDTTYNYGFRIEPVGTHIARTMMLKEVTAVFAASSLSNSYEEMRTIVIKDNAASKATLSNRKETMQRLTQLYGLNPEILLYSALRHVWDEASHDQPVLALLCALARDPLLRATAPLILGMDEGDVVTPFQLQDAIESAYPDRYSPGVLATLGRNTISSWAQSGHLIGRNRKVRARATAGASSAAYAFLLGHLCGQRGIYLFETLWSKVLDSPASSLDDLAFAASQRGWLEYRRMGDVCEFGFRRLMQTSREK